MHETITVEEYQALISKKKSKWLNVKSTVFGVEFQSKHEASCYMLLRSRQDAGEISDLKTQVRFHIVVNEIEVCDYIADFTYLENGVLKVSDAKGSQKGSAYAMFSLKKKLMWAALGIDVEEIYADGRPERTGRSRKNTSRHG